MKYEVKVLKSFEGFTKKLEQGANIFPASSNQNKLTRLTFCFSYFLKSFWAYVEFDTVRIGKQDNQCQQNNL